MDMLQMGLHECHLQVLMEASVRETAELLFAIFGIFIALWP